MNDAPWVNYSGGVPEEIFIGDQISGNLTNSSPQWSTGHYFNAYRFETSPGQAIVLEALAISLNDIKQDLAIEGKYEILEAELLYVEESRIMVKVLFLLGILYLTRIFKEMVPLGDFTTSGSMQ